MATEQVGSPISKTTWFEWVKQKAKIYEQAMDEERRGTIGFSKVLVTDQDWDLKVTERFNITKQIFTKILVTLN